MRPGPAVVLLLAAVFVALAATRAVSAPAAPRPGQTANWVFFTDKGFHSAAEEEAAIAAARARLTPRALARRAKVRGKVLADIMDVPVNPGYVSRVAAAGAGLRAASKWLNAVSVYASPEELRAIRALPFVASTRPVARGRIVPEPVTPVPARKPAPPRRTDSSLDYGQCSSQIYPIQVDRLHDAGLSGAGVLVTVIDSGFDWRTPICFANLHVVKEWDFIHGDSVTQNQPLDPPLQDFHGSMVLSIIAGYDPGNLIGPAYGADYLLAKTEDVSSETVIEEDYWSEAAQWADSLGADVISSSLQYIDWYTYQDMDGNTAISTIAADLAVYEGIAVYVAAGNQGSSPWYYIGAPADADSGAAVGAVDSLNVIADFSSHGPTYDGRTKPDICAMGVADLFAVRGTVQDYARGSGTSFATPLAAGVAALLLEAHPDWTPMDVLNALRSTATHTHNPDDDYGWGVVQGWTADQVHASVARRAAPADAAVSVSPNPASGPVTLRLALPAAAGGSAEVTIVSVSGRLVRDLGRGSAAGGSQEMHWDGRDARGALVPQGIYYARMAGDWGERVSPVVIIR